MYINVYNMPGENTKCCVKLTVSSTVFVSSFAFSVTFSEACFPNVYKKPERVNDILTNKIEFSSTDQYLCLKPSIPNLFTPFQVSQ